MAKLGDMSYLVPAGWESSDAETLGHEVWLRGRWLVIMRLPTADEIGAVWVMALKGEAL
jgi:hypothetical protein